VKVGEMNNPKNIAFFGQINHRNWILLLSSLVCIILLGLTSCANNQSQPALTPITLQLKWSHQFQFAGYYTALEQGYFKEEGLDVVIVAGGPGINVDDEVLSGRANFGILGSELVKKWQEGKSIVLVAPIFQHSIRALMVRENSDIFSVQDLIGKRIVVTINEDPEIKAMILREGISLDQVTFEAQNATSEDRFLKGQIDSVVGSIANQPYLFKLNGVPVRTLRPINYGIDFYGDSLFTSQQEASNHPERVITFQRAVERGWNYAFSHQEETIALIKKDYAPQKNTAQLAFEAQALHALMLPELVEIGHNNPDRWKRIADTYAEIELMQPLNSLDGFFFKPPSEINYNLLGWLTGGFGSVLVIMTGVLIWNRQLQHMVNLRTEAQKKQFVELQKTEIRRRESEALLQRSQKQANLGSFVLNLKTNQLLWSQNMYAIHGLDESRFTGNLSDTANAVIHPDDRARVLAEIEKMVAAKKVWMMEFRVTRSDGVERIMQSSGEFEFDANGQPEKCIGIRQDITERKQAENQIRQFNSELEQRVQERTARLEEINNELEAFSYSISHDLRAPLRAIRGYSEVLLEDLGEKLLPTDRLPLERIKANVQRMTELIDDLLHLSHVTRSDFNIVEVDLSTMAREVIAGLMDAVPERQVAFVLSEECWVQADRGMMRIVLDNLLGNAWKYTIKRADAKIELSCLMVNNEMVYCIRDNGVGFDMAYSSQLFQPFRRLHSSADFEGNGIGLAIVKRIIQRHGGRVWAEGKLGIGTAIYFTLNTKSRSV